MKSKRKRFARPIEKLHFKKNTFRRKGKKAFQAWMFLLPSLIGIGVFLFVPFGETIRRSFTNPLGTKFLGMKNYQSIFSNDAFRLAVANTVRFILVCIPLLLVTSLIFALLIRKILPKGEKLQTACLLPMAIPVASISLLWKALFTQNGILNNLLSFWGVPEISFLDSSAAFGVLVGTYLWRNIGYDMILWLAGLDAIPASMYEAAEVDGANSWQIFWKITLPNLPSTMGLITILSILNTFKVYREAYLVAGNYPDDSIYLLQHTQAEIEQLEQLVNQQGVISSPFSGVISNVEAEVGTESTQTFCTIYDTSKGYLFACELPAAQASDCQTGLSAVIKQGDQTETAAITAISENAENDTVDITIQLTATDWKVGPADAEIVLSEQDYDLCLPNTAIHQDNQGDFVFAVEEKNTVLGTQNVLVRIPVTVLEVGQSQTSIEGAILPEDSIVVQSTRSLEAGSKVRVKNENA